MAYRPDGAWTQLFEAAPGFIRTELWRGAGGEYLTADYWSSVEDFERFQAGMGEAYRRLDEELECISGKEVFVGAFDLADWLLNPARPAGVRESGPWNTSNPRRRGQ